MEWICRLDGGPPRVNHAAVAVDNIIYSFGGFSSDADFTKQESIDVHAFDSVSWRWVKLETTPEWDTEEMEETSTPMLPFKRYGHTVVAYGGKVYLWGGKNDNWVCSTLFCFDPATHHWSVPEIYSEIAPPAFEGHSACVIGNKMYIFGGFDDVVLQFSQDIFAYDFETSTWQFIRPNSNIVPSPRDFHVAVAIGDDMYIIGGRSDEHAPFYTGRTVYPVGMYKFDTKAEVWSDFAHCTYPPNLQGRRSLTGFSYEGNVYLTCGYNGSERKHFNDLYKFDVKNEIWTELKPQGTRPLPRRRMSCCVLGNRIFCFGGTGPRRFDSILPDEMDEDELALGELRGLEDYGDIFILDMKPSLRTMCMTRVLKHGLDYSCLPWDVKWELNQISSGYAITERPRSRDFHNYMTA